jgi:hypothetical protein
VQDLAAAVRRCVPPEVEVSGATTSSHGRACLCLGLAASLPSQTILLICIHIRTRR